LHSLKPSFEFVFKKDLLQMSVKISLQKGDITKLQTDAIVNAANSSLLGGGGVDGAIHKAGGARILAECMEIRQRQGGCKTGEAVITNAGNLPCKKVIHTVGPVYQNGKQNEELLLGNCYTNSLKLAVENGLRAIAFPNISTGVYGYPKPQAAQIAVDKIQSFVAAHPAALAEIIFVCYDDENYSLYKALLRKA
jgi:O-acetyl-ADP-ribose deacetylase (regulator of RNase III)